MSAPIEVELEALINDLAEDWGNVAPEVTPKDATRMLRLVRRIESRLAALEGRKHE
jgi:hypothetical protein